MSINTTCVLPEKHSLCDELADEIHSRSFPKIQGSVTLSQITVLHDGNTKQQQIKHLQTLSTFYNVVKPHDQTSCYYQDLGDLDIRWEYHTEFSTYTFIKLNHNEAPFHRSAYSILPKDWCKAIPGKLIASTHIDIQKQLPDKQMIQQIFLGQPVAASLVAEQSAQVLASFKRSEDGFDRILLINYQLNQGQLGRLIRCLLELSSYRIVSLLSLPVSKALLPSIASMEQQLADITMALSELDQNKITQQTLLNELSLLSAQLENLIADNQFRFDASDAYFDLVKNRLSELDESEISGATSLSNFLSRRLNPAIRTGSSIKKRMLNMSNRIEKASDLLRTTINLGLEEQNQNLLKALNRRSHLQLRLHQLVESVSMVAISYYLVQLISYMIIIPSWVAFINKEQTIALSVPFVVSTVWLSLHFLKKKWRREKGEF